MSNFINNISFASYLTISEHPNLYHDSVAKIHNNTIQIKSPKSSFMNLSNQYTKPKKYDWFKGGEKRVRVIFLLKNI